MQQVNRDFTQPDFAAPARRQDVADRQAPSPSEGPPSLPPGVTACGPGTAPAGTVGYPYGLPDYPIITSSRLLTTALMVAAASAAAQAMEADDNWRGVLVDG